ncbi:hypothetical protein GCM10025771_10760 [Niveibacterium umoris]|uniref:Curved DNA-binding protein CbpA n=1 Tax=Niveibacterium umoris TaxID=1193620 RepID=A0A840BL83_9RHOO|nr:DnaJ domain-containing protein [Niveibacterium umoris]MBB4013373.1 curved DNA-binding protein CbpA [Niveibacterium umoris]
MKKTLYDVLGLPQDADEAALRAAGERLLAEFAPERATPDTAEDFATRRVAVKEAIYTLCDANRRASYDGSLRPSITPDEALAAFAPEAGEVSGGFRFAQVGRLAWVLLALIVVLPAGWWFRLGSVVGHPEDVAARQRAEVERIEREQSEGPPRSPEEEARYQQEREAREQEWRARREREAAERAERTRQQELDRARSEADRVSSDLEYSMQRAEQEERARSEQLRREAERTAAEDRRERARLAEESKRRLERDKAYLERLERENARRMNLE